MTHEQGPTIDLFEAPGATASGGPEDRSLILSSNWSIGALLARGCLVPPSWGEATDLDFFDEKWKDRLPLAAGRVPAGWSQAVREGRRNAFPILIVVHGASTSSDVVRLSDVDRLVFADEEELALLLESPFSDIDLGALALPLVVQPELFQGRAVEPTRATDTVVPRPGGLRRADSIAAVRATLPRVVTGVMSWSSYLERAWDVVGEESCATGDWFGHCLRGAASRVGRADADTLADELMARAADLMVAKYPISGGWPALEVLEVLVESLLQDGLPSEEVEILRQWKEMTEAVMRGTGSLPELGDERGIEYRAITYLLMRGGDVSQVLESDALADGAALRVGEEVRAAAAILAALRTGLRALPTNLKFPLETDATVVRRWMGALGDSVAADLGLISKRPRVSVEESEVGERSVVIDGQRVFEMPRARVEVDATFQALCDRFDWECSPRLSGEVVATVALGTELVFVASRSDGRIRVTAVVEVLDLARRTAGGEWPTPKARRLTKDQLSRMLEVNGEVERQGRIGLSPARSAVVYLVPLSISAEDPAEAVLHAIDEVNREAADLKSHVKP